MFAPKGTPQAGHRPARRRARQPALDDETVRKRFIDLGGDIPDKQQRGPAALAALVKSEIARLTPILQAAGK